MAPLRTRSSVADEVELLQRNIVLSHAVGVGNAFDTATVRAIMLIRANTLARGFSGIRVETLELILEFLNRGVHPIIPEKGSLGASGDLAPLAHFACVLIGEGKAEFGGQVLDGLDALALAELQPITLAAKEGLALTNGTTVMTAVGLLETAHAKRLANLADVSGCMSLEALNGTLAAFDPRIHALRPHPRQIDCAANLRDILEGSEFLRGFDPTNVQDAYTLRCMPQVHGACRDAVAYAEWLLKLELNSVTDNPLIFIDDNDPEKIDVISGGNFHGEPLALAFDYLAIALAELGNISERRTMRLTDENSNAHALPRVFDRAWRAELRFYDRAVHSGSVFAPKIRSSLIQPVSTRSRRSANVEDHVSMGATGALKLRQVADNLSNILAIELLCAAQGIDFRKRRDCENSRLGKRTAPVYASIRKEVPFVEHDQYLKDYIDYVRDVVDRFENE